MERPRLPVTLRQCQVVRLSCEEGLTRKEAAARLGIAEQTAKNHIWANHGYDAGLMQRIGARTMADVHRWWWREGGEQYCDALEGRT